MAPPCYAAAFCQPGERCGGDSAGRCFRLLSGGTTISLSLKVKVKPPEWTTWFSKELHGVSRSLARKEPPAARRHTTVCPAHHSARREVRAG
jgi:hypothetical protein